MIPRCLTLGIACAAAALPAAAQRGDAFDTRLLSPAEELRRFHVPPGFEVQLVASEPDLQKPMNLTFDAAGRLWVTGSKLYPWPARRDALGQPIAAFARNWDDNPVAFRAAAAPPEPAEHGADTVRILSDFDPATGRARTITVFADGLNIPIGVLPLPRAPGAAGDTALVFSIPAIWRLTDTDGDGRADVREKLYDGFGFKDTHGMSSSYWLWFDGWVYGTHGFNNVSEVVDRAGRVTRLTSGNTYRFRPDGSQFEVCVRGQTNPFGLAFDARGDLYTADSHSKPVYLLVPGGYYEGIGPAREHDGLGYGPAITADDHGSSAIAGIAHYSAAGFPPEYRDTLFNGNPVARRINRARLEWRGSSPAAVRQPDFLTSDDPSFRPIQVKLGPDGALWMADFYNPIIGHYEVPLTHPARDTAHGRIWRVVWRGLDGSLPPPRVPNLTGADASALVARLADPNLVVRSLAAAEIHARPGASAAVPGLQSALAKLIAGGDPAADETAAIAILMTLERLGRVDDALLRRCLARPESPVALAALRVLAMRERLPADAESWFSALVGASAGKRAGRIDERPTNGTGSNERPALSSAPPILSPPPDELPAVAPGHAWRAIADVLRRSPQPWAAPLVLAMQSRAPGADYELAYALRLALKAQLVTADLATLRLWAAIDRASADHVADACVAVPTPAAAAFLLAHLEATRFAGARAGDFARHAVLQLPAGDFDRVSLLLPSLAGAPASQRIALAEGLASVAAKPGRTLPAPVGAWMESELVQAIDQAESAVALRAINALKPLSFPEKDPALRRVALDPKMRETNRSAALRALTPDTEETDAVLGSLLLGHHSIALRRTAAEVLGTPKASAAARAALVSAFAAAPADLALTLAVALAKSDAGAADLLELAATGRVRATLLRHRYVTLAFEKRPAAQRERAAALTAGLPPEDARLDALIAQRVSAAPAAKPDPDRGGQLFTTYCAACHRFRDQGGSLGPSLDGIASRSLARLVEDILDPSRNVDPAFQLTTVTLKNGEAKAGMNHREQGDRVLLTDPSTAQELVLAKSDIAATAASPVSPMPGTFESALSEQDFFDLLEFLRRPVGR